MIAKARVAQLTGLPSITAAAEVPVLCVFLLSVESAPFEWVVLKFGSGDRRAGEGTRPYGVSEGAFDLL